MDDGTYSMEYQFNIVYNFAVCCYSWLRLVQPSFVPSLPLTKMLDLTVSSTSTSYLATTIM